MRYYCAYSTLPLTTTGLSLNIPFQKSAELKLTHPIFHVPQNYLLGAYADWLANKLTPEDSKLLFLAFLNSTTLIRWECPARPSLQTVATFMPQLVRLATDIITTPHPKDNFPAFVIDAENSELPRIKQWLSTWEDTRVELLDGLRSYYHSLDKSEKERALASIISSSSRDISSYSRRLANWACTASGFPTTQLLMDDGSTIPCSEYWIELIVKIANPKTNLFSLDKGDILDIQDHISEHLEVGTLFSNAIFSLLESTIDRMDNFLGIDFANPYQIVATGTNGRVTNPELLAMEATERNLIASLTDGIDTSVPPSPSSYPNKLDYIRAMAKYKLAISAASRNSSIHSL